MDRDSNTGHGHVRPRPDGIRARCGGPGICVVCQREQAALAAPPAPVDAGPRADQIRDVLAQMLAQFMQRGVPLDAGHPDRVAADAAQGLLWWLDSIDDAPPPAPAAAAVSDEWNRAIESAARVCDSRELRAHTKSAAACYRLCAQGIRALTRPAPADASHAGDRELDLYDEIECDLPYLFGRASIEGHESGQRLAVQVKAKMRKARAALEQKT